MKRLPIILISLFFPLTAMAALPTPEVCPSPDSSKAAPYQAGFNTGCQAGFALEEYDKNSSTGQITLRDSSYYCGGTKIPPSFTSISQKSNWTSGCFEGYTAGLTAYDKNLQTWPVSPKPNLYDQCVNTGGYKALSNDQYRSDFLSTCPNSYKKAINNPRLATATEFKDFDDGAHNLTCESSYGGTPNYLNGCRSGYITAHLDFEEAFGPLDGANAEDIAFVSGKLANCGLTLTSGTDAVSLQKNTGAVKGCIDGYRIGFEGGVNSSGLEVTGFSGYDHRSDKHRAFRDTYVNGYTAGFAKGAQVRSKCATQQKSGIPGVSCGIALSAPGSIVPNCVASLSPSDPDGCGLAKFVELIQNIIKYLLGVMIPLAILGLGYGGFKIMTAAGNPGKVEEGYGTIKIVVIGIVIALASYLVIKFIFLALGVQNTVGNIF